MSYTSPTISITQPSLASFQADGLAGLLEYAIGQLSAGTAAPTSAPTLSATGGGSTGGSLPAGTIYVVFTETNGFGETTASPEASVSISAGNIPEITFPSLKSGNAARNVYVGTASGGETLYATGVTTSTYNMSAAQPTNSYAVAPPTTNSTPFSAMRYQLAGDALVGDLQKVFQFGLDVAKNWNSGNPMTFPSTIQKIRDAHSAISLISVALYFAGTIIDANPGHLTIAPDSIGNPNTVRVWP